jgi:hypothetical protein
MRAFGLEESDKGWVDLTNAVVVHGAVCIRALLRAEKPAAPISEATAPVWRCAPTHLDLPETVEVGQNDQQIGIPRLHHNVAQVAMHTSPRRGPQPIAATA